MVADDFVVSTRDMRDSVLVPKNKPWERREAVRLVASKALDVEDFLLLLDALGLEAEEGRSRSLEGESS